MAGRRGNGGPDWGNIDWSNFDLRQLGGRRDGTTPRPPTRRISAIAIVLILLLPVPLIFGPLTGFLTDLLWFRSLGLEDVYLRRYTAGFWAFLAFTLTFFVVAVPNVYFALRPQVPRVVVDVQRARPSALGGLFLLLIAFGYVIDQWDLLIRQDTILTGAAYTSINARLPALTVLAFIVGIAALACFANAFARTIWVLGGAIVLWFLASVSVSGVDPGLIQNFAVGP